MHPSSAQIANAGAMEVIVLSSDEDNTPGSTQVEAGRQQAGPRSPLVIADDDDEMLGATQFEGGLRQARPLSPLEIDTCDVEREVEGKGRPESAEQAGATQVDGERNVIELTDSEGDTQTLQKRKRARDSEGNADGESGANGRMAKGKMKEDNEEEAHSTGTGDSGETDYAGKEESDAPCEGGASASIFNADLTQGECNGAPLHNNAYDGDSRGPTEGRRYGRLGAQH